MLIEAHEPGAGRSVLRITGDLWCSPSTPSLTIIDGEVSHQRLVCGHTAVLLPDNGNVTLAAVGVRASVFLKNSARIFNAKAAGRLALPDRSVVFMPAHILMHVIPTTCYETTLEREGSAAAAQGFDYACAHSSVVLADENDYLGLVGMQAKKYYSLMGEDYDEADVNRIFHVSRDEELIFLGAIQGQVYGEINHMISMSCLARRTAVMSAH